MTFPSLNTIILPISKYK